jgi:fructose-1,6-bisphosphatase/inositol monophosphatase family enzyme
MRYSANLNIIIKAIEKATNHISRDFVELENLQSNPVSSAKFTTSCYNRIKQILIDDFAKFRPEFNMVFSDGQKINNLENSEYFLMIHAIDGIENLLRASPDFTVSIALIYKKNGKEEVVCVAISKIIGGELFYCEKGFGAYLNNRRIRISKRQKNTKNDYLIACEDYNFFNKLTLVNKSKDAKANVLENKEDSNNNKDPNKFSLRNFGCKTLEIAYFSSARIEQVVHVKSSWYEPFLLIAKEAGGRVSEDENNYIISN